MLKPANAMVIVCIRASVHDAEQAHISGERCYVAGYGKRFVIVVRVDGSTAFVRMWESSCRVSRW